MASMKGEFHDFNTLSDSSTVLMPNIVYMLPPDMSGGEYSNMRYLDEDSF